MKNAYGNLLVLLVLAIISLIPVPGLTQTSTFNWETVVNNGDIVPNDTRNFNSYNQPSINIGKLVVFRGRSKGGGTSGEPAHGIFTRDMSQTGTTLVTIFDRTTSVPQPDNTGVTFTEPPSFPRIAMDASTVASRGNEQPVWNYIVNDADTRVGTTGIYSNPFGPLITGATNFGNAPGFEFFAVPNTAGINLTFFPELPLSPTQQPSFSRETTR